MQQTFLEDSLASGRNVKPVIKNKFCDFNANIHNITFRFECEIGNQLTTLVYK